MANLILGHTTDTSIKVWVRAEARWPYAYLVLLDQTNAQVGCQPIQTFEKSLFTAVHQFTGLKPSSVYRVKVYFSKDAITGEKSALDGLIRQSYCDGNFTTYPKPDANAGFTFMLGSCNLHSLGIFEKADNAWLEISRQAKLNQASFMLHCGDQIYADIPNLWPPASISYYRDKYMDAWEDCVPAKKMLTEMPHYMILDDHEIINDYDPSQHKQAVLANIAMQVYWEFQHSHNPDSPANDGQVHYHYTFNYGAAQFFVMDTRTHRNSTEGSSNMLDDAQEKNLFDWLLANKDKLKFIVTSVPFVGEVTDPGKDKWCSTPYASQRERILTWILEEDIKHIVFLTGDMHHSYQAEMTISKGGRTTKVYELMSSPINQITPPSQLNRWYNTPKPGNLGALKFTSKIEPNSFYGNHSNVMAIKVDYDNSGSPSVGYKIFRTTEQENGPQGIFHP